MSRLGPPSDPAARPAGRRPPAPARGARVRQTAEARREAILRAAMPEFALRGLHGASTEAIAQRAGVSQPYVFRLYGTKKALFLACIERGFDQVGELFATAAADSADPFAAMGTAYLGLLGDRVALLDQLQAYAACGDAEVRAMVRRRYAELHRWLMTVPGATPDRVRDFLSDGMLLNVLSAVDLPDLCGSAADWKEHLRGKG